LFGYLLIWGFDYLLSWGFGCLRVLRPNPPSPML
jgi:hypothetical protein